MQKDERELIKFFDKKGRMPSYSEIQKIYGYKSKSAAHYLVDKFVNDQILSRDKQGKLLLKKKLGIPFYENKVPAGFPSPAEEELADTLSLDEFLIENKEATFMLTVQGESMIDACIADGDMVLVERTDKFAHNDIVVAQTNDGYTIKYLKKRAHTFWLEPANKDYKPIYATEDSPITLVARVTTVIRKI